MRWKWSLAICIPTKHICCPSHGGRSHRSLEKKQAEWTILSSSNTALRSLLAANPVNPLATATAADPNCIRKVFNWKEVVQKSPQSEKPDALQEFNRQTSSPNPYIRLANQQNKSLKQEIKKNKTRMPNHKFKLGWATLSRWPERRFGASASRCPDNADHSARMLGPKRAVLPPSP